MVKEILLCTILIGVLFIYPFIKFTSPNIDIVVNDDCYIIYLSYNHWEFNGLAGRTRRKLLKIKKFKK